MRYRTCHEPSAILFDWDGTLYDSLSVHDDIKKICHSEFPFAQQNSYGHNAREYYLAQGIPIEKIEAYFRRWEKIEAASSASLFPGVNKTLSYLWKNGVMCGGVTNRSVRKYNVNLLHSRRLLLKYITFFIFTNVPDGEKVLRQYAALKNQYGAPLILMNRYSKPDPRAIDPALPYLRNLPGYPATVYICGDNLVDLACARGNGFTFIAVLSGSVKDRNVWLNPDLRNEKEKEFFGDLTLDFKRGDLIISEITELRKIF